MTAGGWEADLVPLHSEFDRLFGGGDGCPDWLAGVLGACDLCKRSAPSSGGRGSSSPAASVHSPRRRTVDAGIPGGEDRRRRLRGGPRLGARSGPEAVQGRLPAAAQLVGGANDPRRLRRRRPGAGGVRRSDPGGALRRRAAAPRRTDPAAALAERRHDARADGRDPRGPRHIRSQDTPAPRRTLLCAKRWTARRGSPAACFRSTSPMASSP